eukprot:gene3772-7488_t
MPTLVLIIVIFSHLFLKISLAAGCSDLTLIQLWKNLSDNDIFASELNLEGSVGQHKIVNFHGINFPKKNISDVKRIPGGTNIPQFHVLGGLVKDARDQAITGGRKFKQICEIGFNAGASSLAFLCNTPTDIIVHSFDQGQSVNRNATEFGHKYLNRIYPSRHFITYGNSTITLPQKILEGNFSCDFVNIDGGHKYDIVMADIRNFKALSSPGVTVMVDNCNIYNKVNFRGGSMAGVNAAYLDALKHGLIEHKQQIGLGYCHEKGHHHWCRDMCIGTF